VEKLFYYFPEGIECGKVAKGAQGGIVMPPPPPSPCSHKAILNPF